MASHSWTVVSVLPEATRFPPGDQAMPTTESLCPLYVSMIVPMVLSSLLASHTRTRLSPPPEATLLLSGDQATPNTFSPCRQESSVSPVTALQTCDIAGSDTPSIGRPGYGIHLKIWLAEVGQQGGSYPGRSISKERS